MPAHKLPLIWSSAKQKQQVMYKYDPITHRTVRVCCSYQTVEESTPIPPVVPPPVPGVPQIIFANVTGTYSIDPISGNPYISNVYIEWTPTANATSYQVFTASKYSSVLPSTENTDNPLSGGAGSTGGIGGGVFVDQSGPIIGTSYSKSIPSPGYLNFYGPSSTIRLFVFAYNSIGIRSVYPLYIVTFSGINGRIFLDRTNYYDTVTSNFYFFQNGLIDTSTANIDDKPLSMV